MNSDMASVGELLEDTWDGQGCLEGFLVYFGQKTELSCSRVFGTQVCRDAPS